jgi:hypothetical protein
MAVRRPSAWASSITGEVAALMPIHATSENPQIMMNRSENEFFLLQYEGIAVSTEADRHIMAGPHVHMRS